MNHLNYRRGSDPEKAITKESSISVEYAVNAASRENAVHADELVAGNGWSAKLQRFAGRYGVEQRGIERVPSDERPDTNLSRIGSLWLSANLIVSTFTVGSLGVAFYDLGFVDSALVIIFFNILGILPVCVFSTLGPRFGLRQLVLCRFYFGYHGVKIVAVLNIASCIVLSAINCVVGAQLIHAIDHNVPGWVGILIIAGVSLVVSMLGYGAVQSYERYAWVPSGIVFLIVIGFFSQTGTFDTLLPMETGAGEASGVLTFGAAVLLYAAGWTLYAADYNVYRPVDSSRPLIFVWTFIGLFAPLVFSQLLGAALMTAGVTNQDYIDAYAESGSGGLIAQTIVPHLGGFGKFCVAILALAGTAQNCINIYSVALSLQILGRWTQTVPRFIWTFVATCAYVAISVPAYDRFASWLETMLLMMGYWWAIYIGIGMTEHFVIRRGVDGYRPDDYDDPRWLPPGFAALGGGLAGVAGAVMGLSQTWWMGPVVVRLNEVTGGEFRGDLGVLFAFGFSALAYSVLRPVEKGLCMR